MGQTVQRWRGVSKSGDEGEGNDSPAHQLVAAGKLTEAGELLPAEKAYPLSVDIQRRLALC